jgi:hypothetical protein
LITKNQDSHRVAFLLHSRTAAVLADRDCRFLRIPLSKS